MVLVKLVVTFLMVMSAAGSPQESLSEFQQKTRLGKYLQQSFSMDVNKWKLEGLNATRYTASASMSQIKSFSELTGMEIPFSSELNTYLLFKVQETITPSGRSYRGRIALDFPWIPVDLASISFTGELTENTFIFEGKGKTFEVNWQQEDMVLQGTMTVSKTGKVEMKFRPNQKIYDTIDKYFLFFGRMWFGEECTLEKAREVVMVMFEWSCGSSMWGDSLYPEGYAWFQFKIPAFLVPN